jgi:streptomycin 6-kinase
MILPSGFANNIINAFGDAGRLFLADLPNLMAEAAHRWDLILGEPFLLTFNFVCAAKKSDGTPVVLKIGVPNRELTSEVNTLKVYDGLGACRLLDADGGRGMLLLERLLPGTMLAALEDDDRATEIAAKVIQTIPHPVPPGDGYLSLRSWFDELKEIRLLFNGGTGPFSEKTVGIVETMISELFDENRPQVLLHGDFHHFNILSSERGWLVIDPKGVVGPVEYEIGPFLLNPWGALPDETQAIQRTRTRISILADRLGFDPQRILRWAICHSLLSAWWDVAEDGSGGEYSRAWTEIFLKVQNIRKWWTVSAPNGSLIL